MKQAIANYGFHDLKEGVFRQAGDTFLCDDERGENLANLGLVWLKDSPVEAEEPKKAKRASSKKK